MLQILETLHNGEHRFHERPWSFQGVRVGALSQLADSIVETLWGTRDAQTPEQVLALCEALRPHTANWMDEPFSLRADWHSKELMRVPRSCVQHMGIEAYGVHANGYVMRAGQPHIWIAQRAFDKPTFPGQWDNMVGGGLTAGHTPDEILAKESQEEAGLDLTLAKQWHAVGELSYIHAHNEAVRRDRLFIYDIELPEDFEPTPEDGEVDHFELWDMDRLAQELETGDFKYNCAAVALEFMHRHGQLDSRYAHAQRVAEKLAQRFKRY